VSGGGGRESEGGAVCLGGGDWEFDGNWVWGDAVKLKLKIMSFDREGFREFNRKMTGFYPYQYQIRVAQLLMEGKNVILSVPTGAGKTWASIMPFLYAKSKLEGSFPQKMIYSLPLRALTNSIYLDVKEVLDKNGYSEDEITRQTGEFSDDKYFEREMIFSTIDQTLSNFCSFPLAISQRQANVNAGALIGSYLVFDEFHLLDASLSMGTALGMMKMMKNLSRYCIMTATLSDGFITFLKEEFPELNFEIVTLKEFPDDAKVIKSLSPPKGKENKKQVHVRNSALDAEWIVNCHKNRSIVICNRVETAQKIVLEIGEILQRTESATKVICIHSRFFDKHRKDKEEKLKMLLGKANRNENVNLILVATQVIEAGMDISCEVMHTEISPANSFLQRIGRCARFEGEFGDIYVYGLAGLEKSEEVSEDLGQSESEKQQIQRLNRFYLPYERELCESTKRALAEPEFQFINEATAEKLVNRIMGKEELKSQSTMKMSRFNRKNMQKARLDCSKANYGVLVRDIQSIDLVLIDESKQEQVVRNPFKFDSLGMFRWSFIKWVNDIYENEEIGEEDWVIKKVEETQVLEFSEEGDEAKYQLMKLDEESVKSYYDLVFLNAKHFHYDENIGLNLLHGNELSPLRIFKEKEVFDTIYKKDTFLQHNYALLGVFDQIFLKTDENGDTSKSQLNYAFEQLGKYMNQLEMKKTDWVRLIRLMIIFHDYGKLNNPWQLWMQTLQKAKAEKSKIEQPNSPCTYIKDEALGHTDFDKEKDEHLERAIYKKYGKRPPHSGIGAWAIRPILEDWLADDFITNATSLAIARHHGISNISCPEFEISDVNFRVMYELAEVVDFDFEEVTREEFGDDLVFEDTDEEFILYFFLVRILRICDQMATADFEKFCSNKKGAN
jgi:CRISPR-associated endonuclease/helicase Cas3